MEVCKSLHRDDRTLVGDTFTLASEASVAAAVGGQRSGVPFFCFFAAGSGSGWRGVAGRPDLVLLPMTAGFLVP